MATDDDLQRRVRAAKQLLSMFNMERWVYVIATLLSVVFLLVCAVILLMSGQWVVALGMFGASGVISFTTGRLLTVMTRMTDIVFDLAKRKETHGATS